MRQYRGNSFLRTERFRTCLSPSSRSTTTPVLGVYFSLHESGAAGFSFSGRANVASSSATPLGAVSENKESSSAVKNTVRVPWTKGDLDLHANQFHRSVCSKALYTVACCPWASESAVRLKNNRCKRRAYLSLRISKQLEMFVPRWRTPERSSRKILSVVEFKCNRVTTIVIAYRTIFERSQLIMIDSQAINYARKPLSGLRAW